MGVGVGVFLKNLSQGMQGTVGVGPIVGVGAGVDVGVGVGPLQIT